MTPSRGVALSGLSVPLDRVKVQQDVYVTESESAINEFHMINQIPPGSGKGLTVM